MIPDGVYSGEFFRPWVEQALDVQLPDSTRFIGRYYACDIQAVVAVSAYNGWGCEVSIATRPKGLTRSLLKIACAYVYDELHCNRMTAQVQDDNHDMIELMYRLGFRYEGKLAEALPDYSDVLIFGMTRRECPWVRNPQESRRPRQTRQR